MPRLEIVDSVINESAATELMAVTGTVDPATGEVSDLRRQHLIRALSGLLFLPVQTRKHFGLRLGNLADDCMAAYPTYYGRSGGPLSNIYASKENEGKGPNDLPADGGMTEAAERNGQIGVYGTTVL